MKLYYVSNEDGNTEYVYLAENKQEVIDQLEIGESIDGEFDLAPSRNISILPANRRLVRE